MKLTGFSHKTDLRKRFIMKLVSYHTGNVRSNDHRYVINTLDKVSMKTVVKNGKRLFSARKMPKITFSVEKSTGNLLARKLSAPIQ